jgi:thiamine-monophosphate kinase
MLRDLGEGALIRKIKERFGAAASSRVKVPLGDDAAVFEVAPGESLVFCSDLVAENTHFLRSLHPPDAVAYKSVAANVSDVGAMGGIPRHFLVSIAAPGVLDIQWIDGFIDGLSRACAEFDISLLGGDSSSADSIFVDVSMIGTLPAGRRAVLRSGAKAGDGIYVTGNLGSSALGLELLKAGQTGNEAVRRHLYPVPRHAVGAAIAGRAHAMIDVSDGFSTDLAHILEDSRVSARVYRERLPAAEGAGEGHILHGGEQYELIVTGPPLPSEVEGVPLTLVGEIVESETEHRAVLVEGGRESLLHPRGWQHFG